MAAARRNGVDVVVKAAVEVVKEPTVRDLPSGTFRPGPSVRDLPSVLLFKFNTILTFFLFFYPIFLCCFFGVQEYIHGFVAMSISWIKSFLLSRHINKRVRHL